MRRGPSASDADAAAARDAHGSRHAHSTTIEAERDRLLLERSRLECQEANLTVLRDFLDPKDAEAMELHQELLHQHRLELQAFHAALEDFQARYGPLGVQPRSTVK